MLAIYLRANAVEPRPHFTALIAHLMAARAADGYVLEEGFLALGHIAAFQRFQIRFQREEILRRGRPTGLKLRQLRRHRFVLPQGRRFQYFQLQRRGHLVGQQIIEQPGQHLVRRTVLQIAHGQNRALLFTHAAGLQHLSQASHGIGRLHLGCQPRGFLPQPAIP